MTVTGMWLSESERQGLRNLLRGVRDQVPPAWGKAVAMWLDVLALESERHTLTGIADRRPPRAA